VPASPIFLISRAGFSPRKNQNKAPVHAGAFLSKLGTAVCQTSEL
jgi:hypothetical protein